MGEFARKSDGRRIFTSEFKRQSMERIRSGGTTVAALSRELSVAPERPDRVPRSVALRRRDGGSFDLGFSLGEQRVELAYGSRSRVFHGPCYTGRYLGTKDAEKVCANEATALFWDVVHPSSYTQCRQAWFFENAFAEAGPPPRPRFPLCS